MRDFVDDEAKSPRRKHSAQPRLETDALDFIAEIRSPALSKFTQENQKTLDRMCNDLYATISCNDLATVACPKAG
jgi:hypothetical protein